MRSRSGRRKPPGWTQVTQQRYCRTGAIVQKFLDSFADCRLEKEHLVPHNTDGGVELHIVFCHFRDLEFHSDVVQVVIQDRIIDGPIIANRRRGAMFQRPIRSEGSRRSPSAFTRQCQFMLESAYVHVPRLVQRRVEVRDVTGEQRLPCFVEVRNLLQHGNGRAVKYRSELVRRSDHSIGNGSNFDKGNQDRFSPFPGAFFASRRLTPPALALHPSCTPSTSQTQTAMV